MNGLSIKVIALPSGGELCENFHRAVWEAASSSNTGILQIWQNVPWYLFLRVWNGWSLYSVYTPSGGSKWNGMWLGKWCGNDCAEVSLLRMRKEKSKENWCACSARAGWWLSRACDTSLDSWSHEHPHKPFYLLSLYMAVSWVDLFFEFWCVFSTSVCAMGLAVQNSLETSSVWGLQPYSLTKDTGKIS